MKTITKCMAWTTGLGLLGAAVALSQAPAPPAPAAPGAQVALPTGPGVQAPSDAKYPAFLAANCKTPPQVQPGRPPRALAPPPMHRDYKVSAIPGVIAEGAQWKTVWTGMGNNADGPVGTPDGGIMAAQNTDSKVLKLDKDNKVSFPYADTNTGGALAMNKKGDLFVVERGIPQAVYQLAPKRQVLANKYMGEPFECTGALINDIVAANDGGVYFTMGGVYHADAKGVVTKFGTNASPNGIILSPDEKTLYVTGRIAGAAPAAAGAPPAGRGAPPAGAAPPAAARGAGGGRGGLVAYDVQPDGSLTNERQFATVGEDGSAIDSEGRIYSTGGMGVQVLDKNGTLLGEIPSPLPLITVVFSGPDKKTLYGIANTQQYDEIFTIPMIAQGYKSRAK